ncbi:DUF983 domain-containing protein [Aquimarina agarivorans]|uniref:DUF983 domain-containing protein n=1 Tax=Aquimarina agarivorans TaxID=980584 RepID=UPI000248FCF3|nr:DUF983 domain-containing protein [Aquimarina agarivorans]
MTFLKKLYSILKFKCPRCHEGDFLEGKVYQFSKMGKVKKKCSHCNLKYEIETGFFYGAMYVSYALGVALGISVWVLQLLFLPDASPMTLFLAIVLSVILFYPLLYSLSKIIWINFFVSYKKSNTSK